MGFGPSNVSVSSKFGPVRHKIKNDPLHKVYFVGNATVDGIKPLDRVGGGEKWNEPFNTLAFAVTVAAAFSTIYVQEDHVEFMASADALPFLNKGVKVVGLGRVPLQPILGFTAAAATILFDQTGTEFHNMAFSMNAGVDVVTMLDVSTPGCALNNCAFLQQKATNDFWALTAITVSNSVAANLFINDCHFESAADGAVSAIKISAAVDALHIVDCFAHGDYDNAVLDSVGINPTNVKMRNNSFKQLETAEQCLDFGATSTGQITGGVYTPGATGSNNTGNITVTAN